MIRKATVEDANRLAEIHVLGWRHAYRGLVSDNYLFKDMEIVKRASSFKKTLEEGKEETYVYEEEGIVKAFMIIGKSRDEDKTKAYELIVLYVDPFMTRKGVGGQLINYFEQVARESGYNEITLWVMAKNQIGTNFYKSSFA